MKTVLIILGVIMLVIFWLHWQFSMASRLKRMNRQFEKIDRMFK